MLHIIEKALLCSVLIIVLWLGRNGFFSARVSEMLCMPKSYIQGRFKAWKFLFRGVDMIQAEYEKANGRTFKLHGPDHNHIFVSSKEHWTEIRKAGPQVLSMFAATKQMFQPTYTMRAHNWLDDRGPQDNGYVKAVGSSFTGRLSHVMPEMQNIVNQSFSAFSRTAMTQSGVCHLPPYKLCKKIVTELNGFSFFGVELCQDEVFMKNILKYQDFVISTAEMLRLRPDFLKRIVGRYAETRSGPQNMIFNTINDHVTRRIAEKKLRDDGKINSPPPTDANKARYDTMDDTAPEQGGSNRITFEIIAIWFGSVHALSSTVAFVLLDLCRFPEYVEPLRAEIRSEAYDDFIKTTKGLPLLDTFIKESARFTPTDSLAGRRQALQDFVFTDGTILRKGDWAVIPTKPIMYDNAFFPSGNIFDGFRFAPRGSIPAKLEGVQQPEGPSKYADISPNFHMWGTGGIVCPGRFYASIATKLIVAHVLQNYDCSLVNANLRIDYTWRSYCLRKDSALIQFSPLLKAVK